MKATIARLRMRIILLLMLAATLSSCVGTRMGVSWPSIGLIELNGQQHISLAYNDQVAILNPSNGVAARLIDPSSGDPIRDSENNPRNWVLSGAAHENAQFFALPIRLDEDSLLIADYNSNLLKVNSIGATVSRAYPVKDQIVANLLEADDIVYVPLLNDGVIAVSKLDYNEIWASRDIAGVWAQPLLVGDMLVIPSVNHHLVCG